MSATARLSFSDADASSSPSRKHTAPSDGGLRDPLGSDPLCDPLRDPLHHSAPKLQFARRAAAVRASKKISELYAKVGTGGGFSRRKANSEYTDSNGYTSVADSKGYVSFTDDGYWKNSSRPDPDCLETVNLTNWSGNMPGSSGTRYRHKTMANVLSTNWMDGDGHTWHHTDNSGELELLSTAVHGAHYHVGGFSMWGGSY